MKGAEQLGAPLLFALRELFLVGVYKYMIVGLDNVRLMGR
jgi:hypothetical protein